MQQGFSLLEVLITLFLISVGLLGLIDAEINAMRELKLLQQYAFLTQQLSSLDEALQSETNQQAVISGWQQTLKASFQQASVTITPERSGLVVVIQWPLKSKKHRLEETLYD
jgi:prepilin-type N-terminal cleavage/methylation domain-containing protein